MPETPVKVGKSAKTIESTPVSKRRVGFVARALALQQKAATTPVAYIGTPGGRVTRVKQGREKRRLTVSSPVKLKNGRTPSKKTRLKPVLVFSFSGQIQRFFAPDTEKTVTKQSRTVIRFTPRKQARLYDKLVDTQGAASFDKLTIEVQKRGKRSKSQKKVMNNVSAKDAAKLIGLHCDNRYRWNWCHGMAHSHTSDTLAQRAENLYLGTSEINALHFMYDYTMTRLLRTGAVAKIDKSITPIYPTGLSDEQRKRYQAVHFAPTLRFSYTLYDENENTLVISVDFNMQDRPKLSEVMISALCVFLRNEVTEHFAAVKSASKENIAGQPPRKVAP